MGKWYKIKGITREMLNQWGDELKDEIIIYESEIDDEIQARIRLRWWEALIMRCRIMKCNLTSPCLFKLVRDI